MSLSNIIIQRPYGYLLTDLGWYERDGRVAQFAPKVRSFEDLGIAITCRGSFDMLAGIIREMGLYHARTGSTNGADYIAAMPELYFTACAAQGVPSKGRENACDVAMLWYDPSAKRTRGYLAVNIIDDYPGLTPYQPTPVTEYVGDVEYCRDGAPVDLTDASQFDIRRDGIDLVEMQRATPWSVPGYPVAYYVGGAAILTTVGPGGVQNETLRLWPDKVGERILP